MLVLERHLEARLAQHAGDDAGTLLGLVTGPPAPDDQRPLAHPPCAVLPIRSAGPSGPAAGVLHCAPTAWRPCHLPELIAIFFALAATSGGFGRVIDSTPFLKLALAWPGSAANGSVTERANEP